MRGPGATKTVVVVVVGGRVPVAVGATGVIVVVVPRAPAQHVSSPPRPNPAEAGLKSKIFISHKNRWDEILRFAQNDMRRIVILSEAKNLNPSTF
jgi:hypothetical protein